MDKLGQWLTRHPDALVFAAALVMVWSIQTFERAVDLRSQIRRHTADMARQASEALGG